MPLNRLLKYINLLVAALLVIALGLVYWFVYRVLPKTSGEMNAPISAQAAIVRDSHGVPHIRAASIEDAIFLQGFACAQDRLWQMDVIRRLARGELSEILGSRTLESDQAQRRLRIPRLAEQLVKTLKGEDRKILAAYARGVNYFIETHRSALPIEFTLLKYDPRPWMISDTVAIGLQMASTLTSSWKIEMLKSTMLQGGEPDLVNFLFPTRIGMEMQPGSNAWAVSGAHTGSGKPLLANDPHLEFSNPSTWYMNHLQAPGLNVTGVSLPGVPSVVIGHNERIAWGVTNLGFDVQDLYIEKMNIQSGQYVYHGQVLQAAPERDLIRVKGAKPIEIANWVTRHGPVWSSDNGQVLTLKWLAAEQGNFEFPLLDLDRAQNWSEFRQALRRYVLPAQNFVYADVDGNIGYQVGGRLPIRKYAGDVPVDGASGEFEWAGFIPFEENPSAYNPPGGIIVTANQNPFPANYPYNNHGEYAPSFRAKQIADLLRSKRALKPEDMLVIQKDVYSASAHHLAQAVVRAFDKRGATNPALTDAVNALRNWNGQMDKDGVAPMIVTLVYQHLRHSMAERAAPGKANAYEPIAASAVIERLLNERPETWFRDYDQLLLRCLLDGVDEGRRIQGKNVGKWRYGLYNEVTIRQPVLDQIPWIGSYFDIGPVRMSGSSTTVKQTSRRVGPSMRMAVDLSNLENSLQNITIGQSEQPLSWYLRDQWDAYYTGKSFPMQFGKVKGNELRVVPLP